MTDTSDREARLRALCIEKLDLPADTDDQTILDTVTELVDAANKKTVSAAIRNHKIPESDREFWLNALRSDPKRAPTVFASLPRMPSGPAVVYDRAVQANLDGSSRTAAVQEIADQTPGAGADTFATTNDELNARIEADPEMHRAVWAISRGGGGLKPPPERFFTSPDVDKPWDPTPVLVMHEDGTGHYETPEPDDKWLGTQGPRGDSRTGRRSGTSND